jgi:B12 binding domain
MIIDAIGEDLDQKDYLARVAAFQPDLIVNEMATQSHDLDLGVAAKLKELTGAKIAVCGPHPTAIPGEILAHDFIDFVLRGEYEQTLSDLVQTLSNGRPLSEVQGLAYRLPSGEPSIGAKRGQRCRWTATALADFRRRCCTCTPHADTPTCARSAFGRSGSTLAVTGVGHLDWCSTKSNTLRNAGVPFRILRLLLSLEERHEGGCCQPTVGDRQSHRHPIRLSVSQSYDSEHQPIRTVPIPGGIHGVVFGKSRN